MGLFIISKRKASCVCFYSRYYVKFFNTGSSKRPFSFRIVKGRDNMTELEKEKLFKLRVQGCDWKYISKELSAPENTLKSYCYRNGLTDNDLAKILLKSPETIVEALYWIDDIISKAGDGENKSLLLSQAYNAETLRLPAALSELPEEPNRNIDELAYAYWLGYIYRCECLLHEESSRMVYGAFSEKVMRKAYEELLKSPLNSADLTDSAMEICSELDRLLVEKIWPAKSKRRKQLQDKELERPSQLSQSKNQ